jgi:regulatory protein
VTSRNDDDADLAPVTDLFGARSRRRAGPSGSQDDVAPVSSESAHPSSPRSGPSSRIAPVADISGIDPAGPTVLDDGDHHIDDHHVDDTMGADADSPVPIGGPRGQAAWVSPVVGDGSGRSARAEQSGYDADGADAATASVFSISGGVEIDPADAPRPLDEQRADAERLSMRALGRKGVSESELRTMLTGIDLEPDVVEHEIERLTRVGLLDDVALATDLVDRLHDRKGLGRQGVVAELRRRGIGAEAIDAALDAAEDDEDDEFVRAIELAQKRVGQLRGLDRATAERRLSGFLMRKGYNGGVVRIAVERALDGGGPKPGGPRGTVRFE